PIAHAFSVTTGFTLGGVAMTMQPTENVPGNSDDARRQASGDRGIRVVTAVVVLAVAAFAATVSYSHIYDLGCAHGQSGAADRLLPLSVDGLIVAASLVMLHEARNGRRAPGLARVVISAWSSRPGRPWPSLAPLSPRRVPGRDRAADLGACAGLAR